ncbi:MBL fold metallo-hydrolase [Candidatus Symbiopectobacterium sp. NZEC151]|uniref:MBL fold metallo-hydrolase n=1 Tax=Candidatus Symbiopectobacterium sp. NZEC151 TaxID=2820470 RepID=UPI0022273B25|nr:MBL fold metallo-hydrolase [Candidatus Symbiopectobacterium sp. NZEC151]MCW2474186.1 MBL fold metallo-hydrolase [Candidatus Symbiopectobacterium sp. NZEC151]
MTKLRLTSLTLLMSLSAFANTVYAEVAEAPSTVSAHYRVPSSTTVLQPGEKVANLFNLNMQGGYVLQRLTQQTYWFQSGFYATIFYVGDNGVLLFDPLEGHAKQLLTAIQSVTKKPITAIVYSHDHADHIADTPVLLAELKGQPHPPRLIASSATAEKMIRLNSSLPRPTEVVSWPNGSFTFEKLTVQLYGFEHAAHTEDHAAWLLKNERILHAPDLLNPDQPPFWNFAGSERFTYLEQNIKQADSLPWDYFSGGHGNIGSHDDFFFHLKFIGDLKTAVSKAMKAVPFGAGVDTKAINAHTVMLPSWYGEIARRATEELRPVYGKYYGFETATPANAQMVAEYFLSYR